MVSRASREKRLLEQARRGNSESLAILLREHRPKLYALAYRWLRRHEDAEEVVQDGLLKTAIRLRQFQGRSSFYTWAARIVINEALMRLRLRQRLNESQLDGMRPLLRLFRTGTHWRYDPEQQYARKAIQSAIAKSIRGLPFEYRIVLLLRDVRGLSTGETAKLLKLSIPAAKSRLLRARQKIRNELLPYRNGQSRKNGLSHNRNGARQYPVARVGITASCLEAPSGDSV